MAIPLGPIRKMIAENSSYHISMQAVLGLRDIIEELAKDIVNGALQEFQNRNSTRARQGLRPLKRIDVWAIKKAGGKVLKQHVDNDLGLQSSGIAGPGGKNMDKHTLVTKSATEKDFAEVDR